MRPSLILPVERDERWNLAKQMGVETAVYHSLEIGDGSYLWQYDQLLEFTQKFHDYGLELGVIDGCVPNLRRHHLGHERRDKECDLRHISRL